MSDLELKQAIAVHAQQWRYEKDEDIYVVSFKSLLILYLSLDLIDWNLVYEEGFLLLFIILCVNNLKGNNAKTKIFVRAAVRIFRIVFTNIAKH